MALERLKLAQRPVDALFEIERELYEPRFLEVPIGATLTDFFGINFRGGALSLKWSAALRAMLGWGRFCWRGPRHRRPFPVLEPGRLLVTWLSDTPRINDMVQSIVAELRPEELNVIGREQSVQAKLPPQTGFCAADQVNVADFQAWRREYVRCRRAWHGSIRSWLRKHGLPLRLFPHLAYALAARSWEVCSYFQFVDRVRPAAVLTDSEHSAPWSSLVFAARQRGVPTLTMMHGVINPPYGYTPLLSDVALCWGQQQREQMIAMGTEPERLLITGCQRLRRTVRANGGEVRARLGLPKDRPAVMLATSPMPMEEWNKMVYTFGDAFRDNPRITPVVRLHPAERIGNCREAMARYPAVHFLENHAWTVEEAMAACEVVVVHNSGLGNDALVMRRLVVLLDVLTTPLSNAQTLADKAGCPVVRTAADMLQTVEQMLRDPDYSGAVRRRAEAYVAWFCAAFERDAARNVTAELRRRATFRTSPRAN